MTAATAEPDQPIDDAAVAGDRQPLAARFFAGGLAAWRSLTPWRVLFAAAVIAYVWYFTWVSLDYHHGLGSSAYDVGLYDQGTWLLSRFKAPYVTLMGRNLFGDHASFILVFLVPFYWLWPSAGVLFFAQSLFLGLGALPVFLFARKHLHEGLALVLGCVYLLHPAIAFTNRENFHPDSFLPFLIGMAMYGALERKWRLYWVFIVLSLLVKEDVLLVVLPLGIWVAFARDKRRGVATILATVMASLIGMFLVMKNLIGVPTRNIWRIPFGGPSGLLREIIERPGNVIEYLRSDDRPFYLFQMTFPVAFAFLRKPSLAAVSALVLGTNILSNFVYQYRIPYHYSAIAVPGIVMGSVYAIEAMQPRWQRWMTATAGVAAVWSCLMWGILPIGQLLTPGADQPLGRPVPTYWHRNHPRAVDARALLPVIPANASVSAFHSLTAHLAHREQIYLFPNPFRVVLYGPDTRMEEARACIMQANDLQYVMLKADLDPDQKADWDEVKVDFTEVARNDSFVVYHRTGHRVQCELLDGEPFPKLVDLGG
jgi:uncharacterized membrane protein